MNLVDHVLVRAEGDGEAAEMIVGLALPRRGGKHRAARRRTYVDSGQGSRRERRLRSLEASSVESTSREGGLSLFMEVWPWRRPSEGGGNRSRKLPLAV